VPVLNFKPQRIHLVSHRDKEMASSLHNSDGVVPASVSLQSELHQKQEQMKCDPPMRCDPLMMCNEAVMDGCVPFVVSNYYISVNLDFLS